MQVTPLPSFNKFGSVVKDEMLFKEIVDAITHARTDDGYQVIKKARHKHKMCWDVLKSTKLECFAAGVYRIYQHFTGSYIFDYSKKWHHRARKVHCLNLHMNHDFNLFLIIYEPWFNLFFKSYFSSVSYFPNRQRPFRFPLYSLLARSSPPQIFS